MESLEYFTRTAVTFDINGSGTFTNQELRRIGPRLFRPLSELTDLPHGFHPEGDGGLAVLPADTTVDEGIAQLTQAVTEAHRSNERPLYLRFAMHSGEFVRDPWGWTGKETAFVFRMVQAEALRRYQKQTRSLAVIALSATAHSQVAHPELFKPSRFQAKETSGQFWLKQLEID